MRYAVDPADLIALWDTWDEVSARLVAARGRLPEGGNVYLPGRSGALDPAIHSLLAGLRDGLTQGAVAADRGGEALAEAARAYREADTPFTATD